MMHWTFNLLFIWKQILKFYLSIGNTNVSPKDYKFRNLFYGVMGSMLGLSMVDHGLELLVVSIQKL